MFRIKQICFIAIIQTETAFGDLNHVKEHPNLPSGMLLWRLCGPQVIYSTGLVIQRSCNDHYS